MVKHRLERRIVAMVLSVLMALSSFTFVGATEEPLFVHEYAPSALEIMEFAQEMLSGGDYGFEPLSTTIPSGGTINYAHLLRLSLFMFDANMCGPDVQTRSRLPWRLNCHLQDASIPLPAAYRGSANPGQTTIDLSGGFHDAGDHIKFNLPISMGMTTLAWSVYMYEAEFMRAEALQHARRILDHHACFVRRSVIWNANGTVHAFAYQVGDGQGGGGQWYSGGSAGQGWDDHAFWGPPHQQTGTRRGASRRAYFTTLTTGRPGTEQVAIAAAFLAANYASNPAGQGNPDDLTTARALFNWARAAGSNRGLARRGVTQPAPQSSPTSFYQSQRWEDKLFLAGEWMVRATGNTGYRVNLADSIIPISSFPHVNWPLSWDNGWPMVYWLRSDWTNLNRELNGSQGPNTGSPNVYQIWTNWGNARMNTAQQGVALAYANSRPGTAATARADWAHSQMRYILGRNNLNNSYVIGFPSIGAGTPTHPHAAMQIHHRAASGFFGSFGGAADGSRFPWDASPANPALQHLLIGALIGGPGRYNAQWQLVPGYFRNSIQHYDHTETAIDYNASLVLAAAGHMRRNPGQTPPTLSALQPSGVTFRAMPEDGGPAMFTVTFDPVGGTRTGGGQLTQQVQSGGNAVLPTVTRAGFDFAGWTPATGHQNVTSTRTITANWTPAAGGMTLSVPNDRHAVFHLSDMGLTPGMDPEDIHGIMFAGDTGDDAGVFAITPAGAIRVQTGVTGWAGTWQGVDVIPGHFEGAAGPGLQNGDEIQVMVEMVSLQGGAQNNGIRVEASEGREVPAPGSMPTPGLTGHDVAVGQTITITVPVTAAFIASNNEIWGWVESVPPGTGSRQIIGTQTDPRFRIAPHTTDGGVGGSTFIVHDILIHRAGAGQVDPYATQRQALRDRIAVAVGLQGNTQISANGEDVATTTYWTNQTARTTFNTAVTTAQTTANNMQSTGAQLTAALAPLNAAITAFENARQRGSMVAPLYDMQTTTRLPEDGFLEFEGTGSLSAALAAEFAPLSRSGGADTTFTPVVGPPRSISVVGRGGVGQAVRLLVGTGANRIGSTQFPIQAGASYRFEYTGVFPDGGTPRIRIEGGSGTGRVAPASTFDGAAVAPGGTFTHSVVFTAAEIAAMGTAELSLSATNANVNMTWTNVRVVPVPTVTTYTVTRAAASTVPAANMSITPAGAQPAGTPMTVTITPPTGDVIVAGSVAVTGVAGITLTANGATFPMPAGGGTITVNATFEPFQGGDCQDCGAIPNVIFCLTCEMEGIASGHVFPAWAAGTTNAIMGSHAATEVTATRQATGIAVWRGAGQGTRGPVLRLATPFRADDVMTITLAPGAPEGGWRLQGADGGTLQSTIHTLTANRLELTMGGSAGGQLAAAIAEGTATTGIRLINSATGVMDYTITSWIVTGIREHVAPTVTGVTVSPATASVVQGGAQIFTATVQGTNNPPQTVNWSVDAPAYGATFDGNELTVPASVPANSTITVRATSTHTGTVSGTATVTVTAVAPTVTGVTVSPATASVVQGGAQIFTATVQGTNNPPQTVNWSVDAPAHGATFDGNELTVPASVPANSTITVRATSTHTGTVSGTATVTVTAVAATVTGVTVSPATTSVMQGGTQAFTATVQGTNNPPQTVNWSVDAPAHGATFDGNELTVPASVPGNSTITVRATSTHTGTVSGTAIVTVTVDPLPPLREELSGIIANARGVVGATVAASSADEVPVGTHWAQQAHITEFNNAIASAEAVLNNSSSTQSQLSGAISALTTAATTFNGRREVGAMQARSTTVGTFDIVFEAPVPTPQPTPEPNPIAPFLSVPAGSHAVLHLSHSGAAAGTSLEDGIPGVWASGGGGAVHTVLDGARIQVQTGLMDYAGVGNGIDIVPGEFDGLQVGDVVQVMVRLNSIQDAPTAGRAPVNNGFRVEYAPGREAPAPGMNPAPNRFGWDSVAQDNTAPLGYLVPVGSITTLTVPIDANFINAINDEWDYVGGGRGVIGPANPPRFRIASNIVTAWVDNDGLDGQGGSIFTVYDILIYRAGPAPMSYEDGFSFGERLLFESDYAVYPMDASDFAVGTPPGVPPAAPIPTDVVHNLPVVTLADGSPLPAGTSVEWALVDVANFLTAAQVTLINAGVATISSTEAGTARVTVTVIEPIVEPTVHGVTVTGGTANPSSAIVGTTINITANSPPTGQEFSHWSSTPAVDFVNANNPETSFSMPDENVVVTANFVAVAETLVSVTPPAAPSLTEGQSASAATVIGALPGTASVTTNTGATTSLSVNWVLRAGTTFNANPGETNEFTWSLVLGSVLSGGIDTSGTIAVTNFGVVETLTNVTAPVLPSLTATQSVSAATVIGALPNTTAVTTTGATTSLPISWVFAGTTFDTAAGAPNQFTWTLQLGAILPGGFTTSGTVSINNYTPVQETLTGLTPPVAPPLTPGQSANAATVIGMLPNTVAITTNTGATASRPISWVFAGTTFDPSIGASNAFAWTANLGHILPGGFETSGTISVANFACPVNCSRVACCAECGFINVNCNVEGCCRFVMPGMNVRVNVVNEFGDNGVFIGSMINVNVDNAPPNIPVVIETSVTFSVRTNPLQDVVVPVNVFVPINENGVGTGSAFRTLSYLNDFARSYLNDDNAETERSIGVDTVDTADPDGAVITVYNVNGGTTGRWFEFRFEATGTPEPWWSVVNDSDRNRLQEMGLTLEEDGRLRGIPLFAGDKTFEIMADNGIGSDIREVTIRIQASGRAGTDTALVVSNEFASAGDEVTVSISLHNNPGLANVVFALDIPDGLTLVSYQHHPLMYHFNTTLVRRIGQSGTMHMGVVGRSTNFYEDGTLMTLTFAVADNASGILGITGRLENALAEDYGELPTNADGVEFEFPVVSGSVNVRDAIFGDINADERVTTADAALLARWLIGQNVLIDTRAADIDCDGAITVQDLTLLTSWLFGHLPGGPVPVHGECRNPNCPRC